MLPDPVCSLRPLLQRRVRRLSIGLAERNTSRGGGKRNGRGDPTHLERDLLLDDGERACLANYYTLEDPRTHVIPCHGSGIHASRPAPKIGTDPTARRTVRRSGCK